MKPSLIQTTKPFLLLSGLCFCARLLLAITCITVPGDFQFVQAAAPPFEWANVTGTPNDVYGRAMAVDAGGNTYLTGSFDGTATFGSTNITSSGGSNRPDIFVAKYNSAGLLQWVRKAGGTGTDLAFGIAVDGSSNIIVTGSSDSTPFSIGSTNVLVSSKKIVFLKFDSNGSLLWVRTSLAQTLFPPPDGAGTAVGADAAGNLYFAGHFTGPINFGGTAGTFPPPTGGIAFTNTAENDVFLLKYSADGNILWGRQVGGANLQEAKSIAVTPAGDVYLAGRFNGTASFGNTSVTSGNTSYDTDVFLAKWDTAGNFQWVRQVGSNDTDLGMAVAVDPTGAPHLVGAFKGFEISIGPVAYTNPDIAFDAFVTKYTAAGALQWSMQIERPAGTGADEGIGAMIDGDGNLLITGATRTGTKFKNLDFPDGTGSIFVALIENGDTVWVKRAGTVGGSASGDFGAGIGLDASGNIYVGGTLGRNDPASLAVFDSITPSLYGQRDSFVAKIGGNAPPNVPTMSFSLSGTILPTGTQKFYRLAHP
jgi:hypothetical protein